MLHPFKVGDPTLDFESWLASNGTVFALFDDQDSGCVSFGVDALGSRWFVKHAPPGKAMRSVRRAMAFHAAVQHPAIVALRDTFQLTDGLALVHDWVEGEVLYHATRSQRPDRSAPGSPHARFRSLPVGQVLEAVDTIFDAHVEVARQGFVAVDLYDGCFLYDFERARLQLCDLDEYRRGPFVVEEDRLPGSTRFMSPEEQQRGATIDQWTTVFNLGRVAQVLLDEGDDRGWFRGPRPLQSLAERATDPRPEARFGSVAAFVAAWRGAAGDAGSLDLWEG